MRLTELDETQYTESLETSLRLNAFNAQASIELALMAEVAGDSSKAEHLLLQAAAVDRTYVPRWTLAGFYFRRGDIPSFWKWAREATEVPTEQMGALFELCWRVSPAPREIDRQILSGTHPVDSDVLRQFLAFLVRRDRISGAGTVAERLIQSGEAARDLPTLLTVVNRMLSTGDVAGAAVLWHSLIRKGWVSGEDVVPYNGNFTRDPLAVDLDWKLLSLTGVYSRIEHPGLRTMFTGEEPEECRIVQQSIALSSGAYQMRYRYLTRDVQAGSGIQLQIVESSSNAVILSSAITSSETFKDADVPFVVSDEHALLRLQLIYRRSVGTPRIAGSLTLSSIGIERLKHR